jgi:phosphatidylserine decarboxylase
MRPIGEGTPEGVPDCNVIVNTCESSPLTFPVQPIRDVQKTNNFWLKDHLYSLTDMFGGIKYKKEWLAEHFEGGVVYQAFLSALYYHRWHAPIDGVVEDIYSIDGTYFLDQSQFIAYDMGSPNNS